MIAWVTQFFLTEDHWSLSGALLVQCRPWHPLPNLNSSCGYKIHSGGCNVSPPSPFNNEWLCSSVAGNVSGCLWKLPCAGESFLTQSHSSFLGQPASNDCLTPKVPCLSCEVGNAEGPFQLLSPLWGLQKPSLQPGFSSCPIRHPFLPFPPNVPYWTSCVLVPSQSPPPGKLNLQHHIFPIGDAWTWRWIFQPHRERPWKKKGL